MKHFVTEGLISAAETFEERAGQYGLDGYKKHGYIMNALFPNGVELLSEDDFNRFAIFNACVAKMNRYATNFSKGGHEDSMHDLAVYAIMQLDVDRDAN